MDKIKDITGQRFGRLVAIEPMYSKDKTWFWKCQCDCGEQTIVRGTYLRNGTTKSCGCYRNEQVVKASVK